MRPIKVPARRRRNMAGKGAHAMKSFSYIVALMLLLSVASLIVVVRYLSSF